MKMPCARLCLVFSVLALPSPCRPADGVQTDIPFEVSEDQAPDSRLYPGIQAEARRINHLIRDALLVPLPAALPDGYPQVPFAAFGVLVQRDAGRELAPHQYPNLPEQLEYFARTMRNEAGGPREMPALLSVKHATIRNLRTYFFPGNDQQEIEVQEENSPPIVVNGESATKAEAMKLLAEAIFPYQLNANAFTAYETRMKLLALARDWDDYFEKGRPQTFWDIGFTTLMEYGGIKKGFLVGPPPRQWFVLHPNVVIESLDAAPDGDQLGGAVAIEWVGVNWWKLKVPLGISVSSLYSDRPGVKDVGHGMTIYIANKYCVGWASHGGDNGFYASIDALKFIDSKKSKLESYRGRLAAKLGLPDLN